MRSVTVYLLVGVAIVLFLPGGCPQGPAANQSNDNGPGSSIGNDNLAGASNDNSATENGNDNSAGSGEDDNPAVTLSGQIAAPESAKRRARAENSEPIYVVVAQSAETKELYRGTTDGDGKFEIEIPDEEVGNPFTVTILDQNGKPQGPVQFASGESEATTGIAIDADAKLGTIALPEEPGAAPIVPGEDANTQDKVDSGIKARLGDNGAPVGVGSLGKGADAEGGASDDPKQSLDRDKDGLPDFADADNDGDGIVDDFDSDGTDAAPDTGGVMLNFFMNLKIAAEDADTYYSGSADEISTALQTDTVITLEVLQPGSGLPQITGVHAVETPGPSWMPTATILNTSDLWSAAGYEFEGAGDRFQKFVVPNALITAGETITVEITFDDSSTRVLSRMINYVFKNIPKLERFGPSADSLAEFDNSQPILFDGAQDLVLEFRPPPDETGALLTALDYQFEFFYEAASDQSQVQNIDNDATFPSPPAGFMTNNHAFSVLAGALTLSADETYVVTLPKELFIDTAQIEGGGSTAIGSYKIDIAAQKSGNAAIMLRFQKQ